jgi:carbon starvation protein CstA
LGLSAVALIAVVAASILSPAAFVLVNTSVSQMDQLDTQFNDVMNGTMGFMDNAWSVAQEFQNASYHYDQSELGNYSVSVAP